MERDMSGNGYYVTPASVGKNLPTALFGFDKDAVMTQISSIYQTAAARERKLSASIEALQQKNELLADAIEQYEKKLASVKSELEKEAKYNEEYKVKELHFQEEIQSLRKRIESLEIDNRAQTKENSTLHEKLVQSMNIVAQLKDRLSRSDNTISELQNTISMRDAEKASLNSMIGDRELQLQAANAEIVRRCQEIESLKASYADPSKIAETQNLFVAKDNEINNLTMKANALEARIRELENQRTILTNEIKSVRKPVELRLEPMQGQTVEPIPMNNIDSADDIEEKIYRQIDHYTRLADSLKSELDRFGAQIDRFEHDIYSRMNNIQYQIRPRMPQVPPYGAPIPPVYPQYAPVPPRPVSPRSPYSTRREYSPYTVTFGRPGY